jgi:hypothetical protein
LNPTFRRQKVLQLVLPQVSVQLAFLRVLAQALA